MIFEDWIDWRAQRAEVEAKMATQVMIDLRRVYFAVKEGRADNGIAKWKQRYEDWLALQPKQAREGPKEAGE